MVTDIIHLISISDKILFMYKQELVHHCAFPCWFITVVLRNNLEVILFALQTIYNMNQNVNSFTNN